MLLPTNKTSYYVTNVLGVFIMKRFHFLFSLVVSLQRRSLTSCFPLKGKSYKDASLHRGKSCWLRPFKWEVLLATSLQRGSLTVCFPSYEKSYRMFPFKGEVLLGDFPSKGKSCEDASTYRGRLTSVIFSSFR